MVLFAKGAPISLHPIGRNHPEGCGLAVMCYASTVAGRPVSQEEWQRECFDEKRNTTPESMLAGFTRHGFHAFTHYPGTHQEFENIINTSETCTIVNWRDGASLELDGHWSIALRVVAYGNKKWVMLLDPNLGGEIRFLPLETFFAQHEDLHPDTGKHIKHLVVQVPLANTPSVSLQ